MPAFDLAIIGAGVAGLTAATYAGRHGLNVVVIDRLGAGGQVLSVNHVANFPGFPKGIAGFELGPLLQEQAEEAGAEFMLDTVESVRPGADLHEIVCAGGPVSARAVIVAAGSSRRKLGVPGEDEFHGRGVSDCASCDGMLFAGQEVAVVGGGDSALDEAFVLSEHASRVTVVHRGRDLDAQKFLRSRLGRLRNVELATGVEVAAIRGGGEVAEIELRDVATGRSQTKPVSGVFAYVGLDANTGFLDPAIALDEDGRIVTDAMMATSAPGVFAAGDVRSRSVAQLAAAAGDGATAAIAAVRYLASRAGIN